MLRSLRFRPELLLALLLGCSGGTGLDDDDAVDDDDVVDDDDAADDDDSGPRLCNGHASLCDRPFDQAVLPSTHNSMSNRDEGWIGPNQNVSIVDQLESGVRGLLLDTHYEGDELMLCHSWCLLGSKPLIEALEEIRDFLTANPNEVIAIIFQDGISPEDTERAFDEAGLLPLVYTPTDTWPTMGEMIDADTRLIATAEASGPPPAWYGHAWDVFWDTGYSWDSVDSFNCDANRGSTDNGLFLLNHWLSNPLPHSAQAPVTNSGKVLRARVQACLDEHGRLPTMLAVDFHDVGDLMEVVAELNE